MSVPFGLDFGNLNSVLAIARNRGIDIVVNEVSNRSTPSVVGFGEKSRYLGEAGKNKQTSNIKNTVENLKRIVGLKYDDEDFDVESRFFSSDLVQMNDNKVGVEVTYAGEKQVYSAIQLAAMFFDKAKQITEAETKSKITDICITVPAWYSEEQRYNIADAAKIAGLNPIRIVNEVTAAIVSYGVFKDDIPEAADAKARVVAFVDIGHSDYTCSIAAFKKGECKVLATAYDKHFGGRDFDHAIAEHFAKEFQEKHKLNIKENKKAYNRLLIASEKLKKVLSANNVAPFNVESLIDDLDFSSQLTREELEELVRPLLNRVNGPVERALNQANLTAEDIDSVEIIGGTTRIPILKSSLSTAFNKPLSSTLNQDEAIAKGAAFICAIHSPTLRVRPFKFEDIHQYSVSYKWDKQVDDEESLEVFPQNSTFPSTKMITLHRTGDFSMLAGFSNPSEIPSNYDQLIAKWNISGVQLPENATSVAVKLKLRCDPNGYHIIEDAYTLEDIVEQEAIPLPEDAPEGTEPEYKEVTKTIKKDKLKITAKTYALPDSKLNELIELENEMSAQDKLVAETEEKMNELEEYIYSLRSKLEGEYSSFASDEEKEQLRSLLTATEDWLYDEGEDATKAIYIGKYNEIAVLGNVIKDRFLEEEKQKAQAVKDAADKAASEKAAAESKTAEEETAKKENKFSKKEKSSTKEEKNSPKKAKKSEKQSSEDVDMD